VDGKVALVIGGHAGGGAVTQFASRRKAPTSSRSTSANRSSACYTQVTLAKAKDVGYVENFGLVDSQATEDLWQTVEPRLGSAIKAARTSTVLDSHAHMSAPQQAVALHFVRNPQTLAIHNQSFAEALKNGVDRLFGTY
jgi:hypothetical protein